MKKQSASRSAFFNGRGLIGFVLCSLGLLLALAGFSKPVAGRATAGKLVDFKPGTWTATGSMNVARAAFTATLLTNGKVLVAGGINTAETTASAELYDPATGQWTLTGSMTTPRYTHTATLLADGRVLVAGGQVTASLASAELYDPSTGIWTLTGNMTTPRAGHMALLITTGPLSGMVLAAGGGSTCFACTPLLDSAELFDPSTGTWTSTASMTIARYWNTPPPATILPDGSVLVVGGVTCCPYRWFNKAETYDSVNQTWTPTSPKMTNANGAVTLLPDGKVLVAGGVKGTGVFVADAELFDSFTGVWTATTSMSTERGFPTLTLLTSGQALVVGGCSDLSSAELYDSSAGSWFPTGKMTAARESYTATLLANGQVLVAGGSDCEGNILSNAELYTPPPVATLSATSVTFGLQLVGTRSPGQAATLTNTGTTPLTISSIDVSGDFLAKDNCGSSVDPGASCTIKIAFNPSDKGVRTGTVTITDDAANSPQIVALTGTGTVVELSPTSVNFGDQKVGTVSHPQSVTLTNTGSTPLSIRGIGIVGSNFSDFVETTTCGSSVPANSSCSIDVRFAPTATGPRTASVKVRHDGGGAEPVDLTGTGTR